MGWFDQVKQLHSLSVAAVIWDALKAACESDLQTAQLFVNSAGIIVTVPDLSTCFDERGNHPSLRHWLQQALCCSALLHQYAVAMSAMQTLTSACWNFATQRKLMFVPWCATTGGKYELPKYVLSDPSNLISERDSKQQNGQQVELTARRI